MRMRIFSHFAFFFLRSLLWDMRTPTNPSKLDSIKNNNNKKKTILHCATAEHWHSMIILLNVSFLHLLWQPTDNRDNIDRTQYVFRLRFFFSVVKTREIVTLFSIHRIWFLLDVYCWRQFVLLMGEKVFL